MRKFESCRGHTANPSYRSVPDRHLRGRAIRAQIAGSACASRCRPARSVRSGRGVLCSWGTLPRSPPAEELRPSHYRNRRHVRAATSRALPGSDECVPRAKMLLWLTLPFASSVVTHVVVATTITGLVRSSSAPNARPTPRSCSRFKTASTASQTRRPGQHAPRPSSGPRHRKTHKAPFAHLCAVATPL